MSQEVKKGFWEKTTSRREFLKQSGKGVAGVTVSMTVLGLLTGRSEAEAVSLSAVPLATGLLVSDSNRCTGCRRCETICSITNEGKADPNISRVKVDRNYSYGPDDAGHYASGEIIPDTCQQCKDPVPCLEACPMKAIYVDEKIGTRLVNEDKCIGCGMCAAQCPFGMITVDVEDRKAKKCTLCNGDPSCAKLCPCGALKLYSWQEVHAVIERNKHRFV